MEITRCIFSHSIPRVWNHSSQFGYFTLRRTTLTILHKPWVAQLSKSFFHRHHTCQIKCKAKNNPRLLLLSSRPFSFDIIQSQELDLGETPSTAMNLEPFHRQRGQNSKFQLRLKRDLNVMFLSASNSFKP